MATQFTGFTHEGQEVTVGVRFFAGQERGTVFRFFNEGRFEHCTRFEDEAGRAFNQREFFQVVAECDERQFAPQAN